MRKRLPLVAVLSVVLVVGFAWHNAPSARASGCDYYSYDYCHSLFLNAGYLYGEDAWKFPVDPYSDPNCQMPEYCWFVRGQTNTTFTASSMYTQTTGYDSCDGGYSWVQRQTSEAYITSPTKQAVSSDKYGVYSDCGPSGHHIYAIQTYHWEWLNGVKNGVTDWYQR